MADQTITIQGVILQDNWPGTARTPPMPVTNMTCAAVGHNIIYPMWRLGTKWQLYCTGDTATLGVGYNVGWSTFVYLQGAADIASAVAAVRFTNCVVDGTIAEDDSAVKMYVVVGDSDLTTHETMGLIAVSLSTVTNSYYGWYWCGGVAPLEYVDAGAKTDTLATDDSVVASGQLGTLASAATGIALTLQAAASQVPSCGFSLYADQT